MRVLWDVTDAANARITIDFGEKYEPVLAKLGFARVLAYEPSRTKKRRSPCATWNSRAW